MPAKSRTKPETTTALQPVHKDEPRPDRATGFRSPAVATSKWRQMVREAELQNFPDKQKTVFLEHLSLYGRLGHAAAAACVNTRIVSNHRKIDPEFDEAVFEALDAYRERVRQAMFERAVIGWDIPIFGGQYKDRVVGYERQYDSRLLLAEAKRVDPEYRDKSTLDVNVNAGVLLVPQGQSIEDWEATQEQNKLANAKVAELVQDHPDTPTEEK